MKEMPNNRISELQNRIVDANNAYYNHEPSISDEEFDALKDELRDLDPNHGVLTAVGAPVVDTSRWEKVRHQIPMGSQDKVNTVEELYKWAKNRGLEQYDYVCMQEKLDGISLSLNYVDGKLSSAITRGDGVVGEDILRNAIKMKGVPSGLDNKFTGCVRGEIVLLKSDWKKHLSDLANPRNAASGIARRMTEGGQEHLTVICYDIVSEMIYFSTEEEKITKIKDLGFLTPGIIVCGISKVEHSYDYYQKGVRDSLDYDIDGLVVKINDILKQRSMGNSGGDATGNPKGQVALKFSHEMRESVITDVIWDVGLTGRITPVGWINPVKVSGVMIEKASLHNVANIRKLGIRIGCKVLISRRNDVIPFIERALDEGNKDIQIPAVCPKCASPLESKGEYIICVSDDCRISGNLEKWINVVEIENVGPRIVEIFVEKGLLAKPGDLYRLKEEQVCVLDRMGDKSAERIISSIQAKKEVPLHCFFAGLNIPACGRRVFEALVDAGFDTVEKIRNIKIQEIEKIDGLGLIQAKAIVAGLAKKKDIMDDLFSAGVSVFKPSSAMVATKLSGLSFCFTGSMNRPRTELENLVIANGGQVKAVSKGLTYLVIADPNSTTSKAVKARQFGVKLINEADFIRMV